MSCSFCIKKDRFAKTGSGQVYTGNSQKRGVFSQGSGFVCSVECATLVLPWAVGCDVDATRDLYPSWGVEVDRAAAATEMGDLVFACATAASDLVAQHTCLNEYTICQTDQQCMDQIDAYYRDPTTGLFRSGSAGMFVPSLSW
jgi:hypothetical protein